MTAITGTSELSAGDWVQPNLLSTCGDALAGAENFLIEANDKVAALIAPSGKVDPALLEHEQFPDITCGLSAGLEEFFLGL